MHSQILMALSEEFEKLPGVKCNISPLNFPNAPDNKVLWTMRIAYKGKYLATLYAGPDSVQFQWNSGASSKPRSSGRVEYADPRFDTKVLELLQEELAKPAPRWLPGRVTIERGV